MSSEVPWSQLPMTLQFGNSETTGSSQSFSGFVAGSVQFQSGRDPLDALPRAEGASFNSAELEHERLCLPGTRTKILDLIERWTVNPRGERIFWLSGMAGTGKSAIARTLAHILSEKKQLGASFFFSRGRGDRGGASKFFTSIAYQLALLTAENGALAQSIRKAINQHPDIFTRAKCDQWKFLIQEPLSQLENSANGRVLVLVIDALDECDNDEDVKLILRLLCESKDFEGIRFRVFVTGRPRIAVRDAFLETFYRSLVLHEIERYIVQGDLRIFFGHELGNLQKRGRLTLGEGHIDTLVQRAGELFIYAATICSFVAQKKLPPARERLEIVLQNNAFARSPEKNLDELYLQILQGAVSTTDSAEGKSLFYSHFSLTVGSIVSLYSPLSVSSLAKLLHEWPDSIELTLDSLLSVLNVTDKAISLIHPSFRDFLLDQKRCDDNNFWVDSAKAHLALTRNSVRLMAASLRRDICDLQSPGILIEEINSERVRDCIPPELEYACTYWVRHLESSVQVLERDLVDEIRRFLEGNALYWLEALSLLEKMEESVLMLSTLLTIVQSCDDRPLVKLVNDAYRFIFKHRFIIEQAPLQAYCSALVFSPSKSILRKLFERQALCSIKCISKVPYFWGSLMQTLEHTGKRLWDVTNVLFSPNGGKLMCASNYVNGSTIYIWNAKTGKLLHMLDLNYQGVILFNGQTVAVVMFDCVKVWDTVSESQIQTIPNSKNHPAALSSTEQKLACGSSNGSVRVWDIKSGRHVQTLLGHAGDVVSVEFSPNGQKLVSKFRGPDTVLIWDSVVIWDLGSGSSFVLHIRHGRKHPLYNSPLTFSPNGQSLAFGVGLTVEIWDVESQTPSQTSQLNLDVEKLPDSLKFAKGIAFLLDEQFLASWHRDGSVVVWDVPSASLSRIFKIDTSKPENFVAFSPSGPRLASVLATPDGSNIKIWDATLDSPLSQELQGHDSTIQQLVFSPCGQTLASLTRQDYPVSYSIIFLWNVATGSLLETIKYSGHIFSMVFLASEAELPPFNGDLIWDAKCGVRLKLVKNVLGWLTRDNHYDTNQPYGLDLSNRWVTVNHKKVIWLPKARQASILASYGTKVAIGSVSGVVTILDMDPKLIETSGTSVYDLGHERPRCLDDIYASDSASTGDDLDTEDEDTEMENSEIEDLEVEDSEMEHSEIGDSDMEKDDENDSDDDDDD